MTNLAPFLAGIFFGVFALLHLGRLLCPFDVTIAGQQIPFWISGLVFVLAGLMSAWLFRRRRFV